MTATPNPNNGEFTVSWSGGSNPDVRLIEEVAPDGEIVSVGSGYTGSVNLSNKSPGTYTYRQSDGDYQQNCIYYPATYCWTELVFSFVDSVQVTVEGSAPPNSGFVGSYEIRKGDYNSDGRTDIFLTQTQAPNNVDSEANALLIQTSFKTFTVSGSLTQTEISQLSTWQTAQLSIRQIDPNLDGVIDLHIGDFPSDPSFSNTTQELLLFSSPNSAKSVTILDTDFRDFFSQILGWMANPDYFEISAISNGWYSYEGTEATGWWNIVYIDYYYDFGGGNDFLDSGDDPNDPNNSPSFCDVFPNLCIFNGGVWLVYGTFIENIEVVIEYENFNQSAVDFAQAAGPAFHQSNGEDSTAADTAVAILESAIGKSIGTTPAEVLAVPQQVPEPAPGGGNPPTRPNSPWDPSTPEPGSNDPDWGTEPEPFDTKNIWRILTKVGIVVCGLFICAEDLNSDEDLWLEWYNFGWEWALYQFEENDIDPNDSDIRVVIGEAEGDDGLANRIPNAAAIYGAQYYDPGEFSAPKNFDEKDRSFIWAMNFAVIRLWAQSNATFYDIGRYQPRVTRGLFYPCERVVLEGYSNRLEVNPFNDVLDWQYDSCFALPNGF